MSHTLIYITSNFKLSVELTQSIVFHIKALILKLERYNQGKAAYFEPFALHLAAGGNFYRSIVTIG